MRLLRHRLLQVVSGSAVVALAALGLGYAFYVEAGRSAGERTARERGCFILCHRVPTDTLGQRFRKMRPGEPLVPPLEQRLQQVHPVLSRGVERELASLLAAELLPELARGRAGSPGKQIYLSKCAACHGKDGSGSSGDYPPLMGSEWLTDEPSRLPEILEKGLQEPISVKGEAWDKTMRAPGISSAEEAQQLMDYLRSAFVR